MFRIGVTAGDKKHKTLVLASGVELCAAISPTLLLLPPGAD